MKRIIIVGAGAAGLAAAVTLKKENPVFAVTVLERASKAGKKILAAGNGRCNLTNVNAAPQYYNNPAFLKEFFKTYNYEYIKRFYNGLGLLICPRDAEGRAYPVSNTAASVMDVYSAAVKKYSVEIVYNAEVTGLGLPRRCAPPLHGRTDRNDSGYIVKTADGKEYSCDCVIWAAGSPAGAAAYCHGDGVHADGERQVFAAPSGHSAALRVSTPSPMTISQFVKTVPFTPSLCPLPGDKAELKYLENIRVKCRVSGLGHTEDGEVQFRKDSLSGIVIFNFAARLARQRLDETVLSLDLFPDTDIKELTGFIHAHNGNLAGLCANGIVKNISERGGVDIADLLKNYQFKVYANRDFKEAQSAAGGADLSEIDSLTFEVKKHKGLYIAGEALDIDGECGGYNLHFAAASGIAAALNILNG